MDGNWDNPYAKEQVWVLKDTVAALEGQLSSYRRAAETAEVSVPLPVSENHYEVNRPIDPNPNVFIPEKLMTLKTTVLDKVRTFFQYRLGFTLDFSNSLLNGIPIEITEDAVSPEMLADKMDLKSMADHSLNLNLPIALNQYSYCGMFIIGLLKYLNDHEYIRRVSTKVMQPLPQYRQNWYNHLRYKFHRYKIQFKMASKHDDMKIYNDLRMIGWNLIDRKFVEVNNKTESFIAQFNRISSENRNTDINTIIRQETQLYQDCLQHHTGKMFQFLELFGVEKYPFQPRSQDEGSRLVPRIPQEDPSFWTRPPLVAAPASALTESEDSMFLSGHDASDEASLPSHLLATVSMPLSPGAHSVASSSESDCEEEIGHYEFLLDPLNFSWMDEPPAKHPRRGN